MMFFFNNNEGTNEKSYIENTNETGKRNKKGESLETLYRVTEKEKKLL